MIGSDAGRAIGVMPVDVEKGSKELIIWSRSSVGSCDDILLQAQEGDRKEVPEYVCILLWPELKI